MRVGTPQSAEKTVLLPVLGFPINATRKDARCDLLPGVGDVGSGETMGGQKPESG